MRNKPNLFIIGAAKAGTTAFHNMFSCHPNIYMSPVKEPHFFSKDIKKTQFSKKQKRKFENAKIKFDRDGNIIPRHQLYIDNEEDYLDLFKPSDIKIHRLLGEASVSYLYSECAAKEIFKFNPTSKVIIILRDPIERAFSHFLMDLRLGNTDHQNFIKAVKSDFEQKHKGWGISHLYVELGLYSAQIERFLQIFPKNQIKIIPYENFKNNNQKVLQNVYSFLGVPYFDKGSNSNSNKAKLIKNRFYEKMYKNLRPILGGFFSNSLKSKIKNRIFTTKGIPQLSQDERIALLPFFLADIKKLEKLISINFSHWVK